MAKSDSTRKPKLPKVWIEFWASGKPKDVCESKPVVVNGPLPSEGVFFVQYAPVQPPLRCVWQVQGGDWLSPHGRIALYLPKFCEDCGGKIVRKR